MRHCKVRAQYNLEIHDLRLPCRQVTAKKGWFSRFFFLPYLHQHFILRSLLRSLRGRPMASLRPSSVFLSISLPDTRPSSSLSSSVLPFSLPLLCDYMSPSFPAISFYQLRLSHPREHSVVKFYGSLFQPSDGFPSSGHILRYVGFDSPFLIPTMVPIPVSMLTPSLTSLSLVNPLQPSRPCFPPLQHASPFLGSGPKGPMFCRTQGWISRRPSVCPSAPPPAKASEPQIPLNNMENWRNAKFPLNNMENW